MNFDTWYKELISDQRWFELLRHYKDETIKKASEKVYAQLVADRTEDIRPMKENRKHVYNIACQNPGDKPKAKPWYEQALEKKIQEDSAKEEWKPASDEHVKKCVAEFDEMMKNSTMLNHFPRVGYKQSIEEGGWLPKKEAPYPATSKEEAYIKDRRFEYIKANFEARTGAKLPSWISEEDWNIQYDNDML